MSVDKKQQDLEVLDLGHFEESEYEDWDVVVAKQKQERLEELELEEMEEDKKHSSIKEVLSWAATLVIAVLLAFFLKNYIIINASVPTGSMQNTIQPDDLLFGSRLAYLKEEPERGDVIFFYYPDDETQRYVKRVIGLPGEKITIIDGKVYIDDSKTPLDEPYLKEAWIRGTGPYEFIVPEDSYFCMGDNRNNSHDARYWVNTYVTKDKIIGKALYVYYPFDHAGEIK